MGLLMNDLLAEGGPDGLNFMSGVTRIIAASSVHEPMARPACCNHCCNQLFSSCCQLQSAAVELPVGS
jgi:hypothetical protein